MGSAIGEITGANKRAARSAGRAAMQQQEEAKKFLANQQVLASDVEKAQNDPRALMAQEEALNAQSRHVARQEELIGAINPALKEAAIQALGLLRGDKAASLGPLERQRAQQRQTMLNTLREQLGPGAETSSAGMQAIQRFDEETSNILGNAQQTSISSLLGTTLNARPNLGQDIGGLFDASNAGLNRAMSGTSARSNLTSGAFNAVMGNAGADQVEGQIRAQQRQKLGGEVFGAGASFFAGGGLAKLGGLFGAGAAGGAASGLANASNAPGIQSISSGMP